MIRTLQAHWGLNRHATKQRSDRATLKHKRRKLQGPQVRPCIEALEDRLALTVLTVNSLTDGAVDLTDTTVTLRDAIHAANNDLQVSPGGPIGSGADEIRFQAGLTGTITLNQGQLGLRTNLTITGPGPNLLTISGNNASRIFDVTDPTTTTGTVTISGLRMIAGNNATGGAIANQEILTVTNSVISGNSAGSRGGGIYNLAGTLTVHNSTISGNATGFAGSGGGIFNWANLNVQNSTINGNAAGSGTFANNYGGGIYNRGTLSASNSTISGNLGYSGGGVWNRINAVATMQNVTLSGNQAPFSGSGIFTAGTLTLHNTIVADNFRNSLEDNIFAFGTTATGTNNLIGTGFHGGFVHGVNGNQVGVVEPGLGPLASNGGPTLTHALLPCSPAINAGNNAQATGTTDQRGAPFARIALGTVDIGALEVQSLTLVVSTTADENDGDCAAGDFSLREAINVANSVVGADTITFDNSFLVPRVITLNLGPLQISSDLTIHGRGAQLLTISGNNASRVFAVDDSSSSVRTVAMSGMRVTAGSSLAGGGIFNAENLTLQAMIISGNAAVNGGGIFNDGVLTVQNSAISGNSAVGVGRHDGGGVHNTGTMAVQQNSTISDNSAKDGGGVFNVGAMTVQDSTFSGNSASYDGGGFNNFGTMTVENSTIRGNSADFGGGVWNANGLTVQSSTISGNSASNHGGGFCNNNGDTMVLNSTISGNTAANEGGGIYTHEGTNLTLRNTTITANSAGTGGGLEGFGLHAIHNTIIADNFANGTEDNIRAAVSGTYNLIGTGGSGGLINGVNGNQVGVANPRLGPLADNGGPTMTHAILNGSTAFHAGDPNFVPPPNFDQRGAPFVRVSGGRLDIGAFEFQTNAPDGDFNDDGLYNGADIDALVAAIAGGTNPASFDLTQDGLVNLADRDAWLAEAGGVNLGTGLVYLVGDANLDGFVDGIDFIQWNANKFTSVAAWSRGDFNADGVVDGVDFILWNANKFMSSFRTVWDEWGSEADDAERTGWSPMHSLRRAR